MPTHTLTRSLSDIVNIRDNRSLRDILAERDKALAQVKRNAGKAFFDAACKRVLTVLAACSCPLSGEQLTDDCVIFGIVPASGEARAFGAVYASLSRRGLIEKAGTCQRRKGHLTGGGTLWRLAK